MGKCGFTPHALVGIVILHFAALWYQSSHHVNFSDSITMGVVLEQVNVGNHLFVFHSSPLLLPDPSSCCQIHPGRQPGIFTTRNAAITALTRGLYSKLKCSDSI